MTEKKENILKTALKLFARDGYKATSTSNVARMAEVSEGLIFRHFTNKEGLLKAILREGEEKAKILFADIVLETDPKEVIKKTLDLGIRMKNNKEDATFWKLQYKLKWETENYGIQKMEPLIRALRDAFIKLEYENPEQEAENIITLIDGLATRLFLQNDFDIDQAIKLLKKKYDL